MSVLEVCDLRKRFGKVQALDGVDLAIDQGEVYGFIGPNGAGKSTTIRILLGILKANSGSARIFGRDAWREAVDIHRQIAYVPGDVNLWGNLSGGEVIDLFLRLREGREGREGRGAHDAHDARGGRGMREGRSTHDAHGKRYRADLIERFDFDPTKKCATYSKGNRQKVALVAAFSADADLYILDEPTSGLDPLMELVFRECVAEAKARGASVLLSSHILSEVELLCDRVSIIRQGRIIDSGTLADLRHLTRNKVSVEATAVLDGLAALPGVYDVVSQDGTTQFSMDNAQTAMVLAFLADKDVQHLISTPPTLEELFMSHYAGR